MLSVLYTSQGKLSKLPLDILTCLKGVFRYVKWILSSSFLPKAINVVLLQFTYFLFELENSLAKGYQLAVVKIFLEKMIPTWMCPWNCIMTGKHVLLAMF